VLLGILFGRLLHFGYGVRTLYDVAFNPLRLYNVLTLTVRQNQQKSPTTPTMQRLPAITHDRFGLFRLLSLPVGTEMFHFPTFPLPALYIQAGVTRSPYGPSGVSPFGHPRITARLSAPRGLSQITTSFFGSRCQGIHRLLLET
jgi:hypothetical protein